MQHNMKVMIAACDTFRSGAVEQLRTHCQRLGVALYERGYEKDPAKVGRNPHTPAHWRSIRVCTPFGWQASREPEPHPSAHVSVWQVAFEGVKQAEREGADVLLVDTAGRMQVGIAATQCDQSNQNTG